MKRKLIRKIFDDDVFKAGFIVQRGGDVNDGIKVLAKKLNVEPWKLEHTRRYGHFSTYTPYKSGLIWLRWDATPAAIAHECFHAAYYILSQCGLKLTDESEETYSYYLEWLIEETTKRLWPR